MKWLKSLLKDFLNCFKSLRDNVSREYKENIKGNVTTIEVVLCAISSFLIVLFLPLFAFTISVTLISSPTKGHRVTKIIVAAFVGLILLYVATIASEILFPCVMFSILSLVGWTKRTYEYESKSIIANS